MKKRMLISPFLMILPVLASCSSVVPEHLVEGKTDSQRQISVPAHSESKQVDDSVLTSLYVKAIEDYMDAVYRKDRTAFDTMFIIRRRDGQTDDFPDIRLPQSIRRTRILLLTQEQADQHSTFYRQLAPCINLIGWVEKEEAEFIFVTFYPGYDHQYDGHIRYRFQPATNEYVQEDLTLEVLIRNKKGNPDHYAVYRNGKHSGNKPLE